MKIVSYNVNGIRAAIKKGLWDWMEEEGFDVLCVQETKAQEGQVPTDELEALGYFHNWHYATSKKGYSGVATFSKVEPTKVIEGIQIDKYDCEGRVLRTDFDDWTLLNCYFPSGTTGDIRQGVKMDFLQDFFEFVEELRKERPKLIILGDYNIAHREIDIHDPKRNKKTSGFLPEERAWLDAWQESGLTDAYRHLNPDEQTFSWWSYRAGARKRNKGWRIDYQWITENMVPLLKQAKQLTDIVHSDHCPVLVELDLRLQN